MSGRGAERVLAPWMPTAPLPSDVPGMSDPLARRVPRSLDRIAASLVLAALLLGLTVGCGQQLYEQRLAESAQYFAYVGKVDASVGPPWKNTPQNPGPVEAVRVPLQFKEIKKPAATKDPDTGEMIEPEVDPRQPDYVALEFPGLVGSWDGVVRCTVDGKTETRKSYLYLVTNAFMFTTAEETNRAPEFIRELLVLIGEKLGIQPPDPTTAQREQYPRAQPFYVPQKTYDVYRMPSAFLKDGVEYSLELYVQHNGPIDLGVVVATPMTIDPSEKLAERIPIMLETLKITAKPIGPAVKGAAPTPAGKTAF